MTIKEFYVAILVIGILFAAISFTAIQYGKEDITTVTASDSVVVKIVENDTLKVDTIIVKD